MDETFEDEDCFLADLKPGGGLNACGSMKETCDDLYFCKKKKKKVKKSVTAQGATSLQKIESLLFVRLLTGRSSIHFLVLFVGYLLTVAAPTNRLRLAS